VQNSSEFQYIAIDTIHESATNPRRTFDDAKLQELAESIRTNGLIQPITVRPDAEGFEVVAGARRFRASQLAEMFSIPARIVEISDAQTLEWQLVENSQRVDVHPYEEAQGFQRLLDMPGYDLAALVEKSGKSASHIYALVSSATHPSYRRGVQRRADHRQPCQPGGTAPARVTGRSIRPVLAQGLAGQGSAFAPRQASQRMDTGEPLP
jgi:ParB/RepB/Spo0J family partition protein